MLFARPPISPAPARQNSDSFHIARLRRARILRFQNKKYQFVVLFYTLRELFTSRTADVARSACVVALTKILRSDFVPIPMNSANASDYLGVPALSRLALQFHFFECARVFLIQYGKAGERGGAFGLDGWHIIC